MCIIVTLCIYIYIYIYIIHIIHIICVYVANTQIASRSAWLYASEFLTASTPDTVVTTQNSLTHTLVALPSTISVCISVALLHPKLATPLPRFAWLLP